MDHNNLCYGCMEERGPDKICPHCGYDQTAGPASSHHLAPGTLLHDKYLIGRVLGQGGFGITYLAWDVIFEIKLAVKEFFPMGLVARSAGSTYVETYAGEQGQQFSFGLDRFLGEAKTLARFSEHPNVVTVRDFFKANNTAYMVMNHIEGLTLEGYLKKSGEKIAFPVMLEIMMPVMDALQEIHRTGVMHRDVSPDNIFIRNDGRVILIDFGAARQELHDKSKSLSVILKSGYAPPEQYQSRGRQGPWTDIYAVAATMYRCITGETPLEAIDRLTEDDLVVPSQLGVDISAGLEQALLKALAVRAGDRFQTVEEFQAALLNAERDSNLQESYAGIGARKPAQLVARLDVGVEQDKPAALVEEQKREEKKDTAQAAPEIVRWGKLFLPLAALVIITLIVYTIIIRPALSYNQATLQFEAGDYEAALASFSELGDYRDARARILEIEYLNATNLFEAGDYEAAAAVFSRLGDYSDALEMLEYSNLLISLALVKENADYYIDSINGTIPLGDLPIGARVVDPSWEWEYRLGLNYSDEGWVLQKEEEIYRLTKTGQSTPPGEVKPVTWLVVARDHYDLAEGHVTLLSEELIGSFAFDDSTDRDHEYAEYGYNHWGESGTGNANHGLRPWLNSTGIHSGEGFYQAFSESFKSAVLTTNLPNKEWQNGSEYSTQDKVFLPSTTELGDTEHDWTYQIGDVYTFFSGAGDEERVAMMVGDGWSEIVEKLPEEYRERWGVYGNKWFYWTRSPDSRYGLRVRGVSTIGAFYGNSADYDNLGVRPALNLKSGILVSEINP